jgi:iron(II)-dependent oxidoreductase
MRLLPLLLLLACGDLKSIPAGSLDGDSGGGGSDGDPPAEDADGDGFLGWRLAEDPALADCDDNDATVTPAQRRLVPAGPFWRGAEDFGDELAPLTEITLSAYCADVFEVTNAEFAVLLDAAAAEGHPNEDDQGRPLYDFLDQDDEWDDEIPQWIAEENGQHSVSDGMDLHPVTEVYPWSGEAFCAARGGRLPTEAEWEKAARGEADTRTWPWGDTAPDCDRANIRPGALLVVPGQEMEQPCQPLTTPVGSYTDDASPYGLYDLSGNVAEWVSDWYRVDTYTTETDTTDPQGPDSGEAEFPGGVVAEARMTRGGAFPTEPIWDTVFSRYPEPADASSNGVGFRCVYPLDP